MWLIIILLVIAVVVEGYLLHEWGLDNERLRKANADLRTSIYDMEVAAKTPVAVVKDEEIDELHNKVKELEGKLAALKHRRKK